MATHWEARPRTHQDERHDLAQALASVRRLRACAALPEHFFEAVDAFADLLALYAPERSLMAAGEES